MLSNTPPPEKLPADASRIITLNLAPRQWFQFVRHINRRVQQLQDALYLDPSTPYLIEWERIYNKLDTVNRLKADSTYANTVTHMFGDPETFYDYCQELINMTPPLKAIITIQKLRPPRNDNVRIKILPTTAAIIQEQHKIHNECLQSVTTH